MSNQIHKVMYYNTTHLSGDQLKEITDKVKGQDSIILSTMKRIKHASPCDVWEMFKSHPVLSRYQITSIRRSFNTLTEEGHLIKTNVIKDGAFGRPVHVWKMKEQQGQIEMFK